MAETNIDLFETPIENSSQDRLDRGPFAHLVAQALLEENNQGATVIGLTGPWGSGKSSVAAMILEHIGESAEYVEFRPWMVGSREALVLEFFKTLAEAVLPHQDTADKLKIRQGIYNMGRMVAGAFATSAAQLDLKLTAAIAGTTGISALIGISEEVVKSMANEKTLAKVRQEVKGDLANLSKPVVIVIDDIDRLETAEIRTVFQLIKACADFANVRYLLLFDRAQVVNALIGTVNDPGAFLERIIGCQFDLPESTTKQRTAILDEAIEHLGLHSGLGPDSFERLTLAFNEVLLPGLPTIRHVKRFVNTVRALLPGVIIKGYRNIDPADFLLLEYVRQYAPSVYEAVRDEVAPSLGGRQAKMMHGRDRDAFVRTRREATVESLPEPKNTLIATALRYLYSSPTELAGGDRRFNSDLWRPVYLGFQSARAAISEQDWILFIEALRDFKGPQPWMEHWCDRERRQNWVRTILTRTVEIPWSESVSLLHHLFCWGELQRPETSIFHNRYPSWESCLQSCVEAIMAVTPDELDPVEEISTAIKSSKSVIAAGYAVGFEVSRPSGGSSYVWSTGSDLEKVASPLRDKIAEMWEDGSIWDCCDVTTAFTVSYYLLGNEMFSQLWNQIASDESLVIKYLNNYVGAMESYHSRLEEGALANAIRSINPDMLTENGRKAQILSLASVGSPFGNRRLRRRPESSP